MNKAQALGHDLGDDEQGQSLAGQDGPDEQFLEEILIKYKYGKWEDWQDCLLESKAAISQYFGRRDKEHKAQIELIQKKLKKLNAAIFAVDFYLNKPYPDDPRWTPSSRFVQPALKMLSEAVFNNKDIGELAAMAALNPSTSKQGEQHEDS